MSRSRFSLVFTLLAAMTIWGCAQSSGGSQSAAAKATRLQEEVHSLTTQRDQLRADFKSATADKERLQAEVDKLRLVMKERDELRESLATRTAERDQSMTQLDAIKKGVKALMDQVEAAVPTTGPALGTTETKPASNS
jgi:outer membrane murein-binding lipoprotein Lpp